MSLAQKLSAQAFWASSGQFASTAIGFAGFLIIVRLLDIEAYGIFALAVLFVELAQIFVGQHVPGLIVQREDLERGHETASFALLCLFAGLSAIALYTLSGVAANWFDVPELARLMRATAILPVLMALSQVPAQILIRQLRFKETAIGNSLAKIAAVVVGIGFALLDMGFWTLFAMEMARQTVLLVFVFAVTRWVPGLRFDRAHLDAVLRFSLKRIENEGLSFVAATLIPRVAIGQFLGAEALGLFDVAKRLLDRLRDILITPIGSVAFPAVSRMQDDPTRMRRLIEASIRISTWVYWPVLLGLIALAPVFVPLALGQKWSAAVPIFQFLAIAALRSPVYSVNKSVLMATAHLQSITRTQLAMIGLILILLPLGIQGGIVGVAAVLAFRQWIIWPVVAKQVEGACGLAPLRQVKVLLRAAWPAMVAAALVTAAMRFRSDPQAVDFVGFGILGVAVYVGVWSVANRQEARHLFAAARSLLRGDRDSMKAQLTEVLR